MSPILRKGLFYGAACPLFFLFALVVGAYWTFPYDHLRDYIVQEAGRGGAIQLEIDELSPSFITGVDLEGVRVRNTPESPNTETAELVLSEASARISLLSLMGGTIDIDYEATIEGGGSASGNYADSEDSTHIEADLQRIDLARVGPLHDMLGLPATGLMTGVVDLTIADEAVDTSGSINVRIQRLSIADGETSLVIEALGPLGAGGLTLERLDLGTLELEMQIERGTGSIETLHAAGDSAELWGTGTVRFARPLERSGLDVLLRINFDDSYKESSGVMAGLFVAMESIPQMRPARTPNGALQWRIQGTFGGNVRAQGAGRAPMPEAD